MKKFTKIPTNDLGAVAYYLIQITQGVFKWNGELFFCPFVVTKDKKHPLRVKTWTKEAVTNEDIKHSLPFINFGVLVLAADPVDPLTYTRTKQRSMDRLMGIDSTSSVYKKGTKLIVKDTNSINILEFVRKITDEERIQIYNSDDKKEIQYRHAIWKTSKIGESPEWKGIRCEEWVRNYQAYRRSVYVNDDFTQKYLQAIEDRFKNMDPEKLKQIIAEIDAKPSIGPTPKEYKETITTSNLQELSDLLDQIVNDPPWTKEEIDNYLKSDEHLNAVYYLEILIKHKAAIERINKK